MTHGDGSVGLFGDFLLKAFEVHGRVLVNIVFVGIQGLNVLEVAVVSLLLVRAVLIFAFGLFAHLVSGFEASEEHDEAGHDLRHILLPGGGTSGIGNLGDKTAEAEDAYLAVMNADEAVRVVDPKANKVLDDSHGGLVQGGGNSSLDRVVKHVVVVDQRSDSNLIGRQQPFL